MMNKICFIKQFSGLGDILFTIKIAQHYSQLGYKIIWPVLPTYKYLNEYLLLNEDIKFYNIEEDFPFKEQFEQLIKFNFKEVVEINNFLFVPLESSTNSIKVKNYYGNDERIMFSKYDLCGLEWKNWQDYFEIKRNFEEESSLEKKILGISEFHFVNLEFGTPPYWKEKLHKNINTPDSLTRVEMHYTTDYTIFAWLGLLEKANKIDVVSSSTFFLFEKIKTKCIPTIYSRNHSNRSFEENFDWMKKVSRNTYNFVS